MKRLSFLLLAAITANAGAQQKVFPTVEQQIAVSVLALPANMQAGATVMGYKAPGGKLEVLRQGTNGMNCLAQFAVEENFHVSCYHEGMEPFMLRGRQLREQGIVAQVDSVRFLEVREGKLKMPAQAALYQIFGNRTSWNASTNGLTETRSVFVVYVPGATSASTGLPSTPQPNNAPWLMNPGTPKAHIMFSATMR